MSVDKTIKADGGGTLAELLHTSMQRLGQGVSITRYQSTFPGTTVDLVYEVRMVLVNGARVPRSTDAAVSRERKGKR